MKRDHESKITSLGKQIFESINYPDSNTILYKIKAHEFKSSKGQKAIFSGNLKFVAAVLAIAMITTLTATIIKFNLARPSNPVSAAGTNAPLVSNYADTASAPSDKTPKPTLGSTNKTDEANPSDSTGAKNPGIDTQQQNSEAGGLTNGTNNQESSVADINISSNTQKPNNITNTQYPNENGQLTLDKVKELSKKGDSLSWDDFSTYTGEDIGSGLYIIKYIIDDKYSVIIGGTGIREKPIYIRLVKDNNFDNYIDIRYDDIDTFISG